MTLIIWLLAAVTSLNVLPPVQPSPTSKPIVVEDQPIPCYPCRPGGH